MADTFTTILNLTKPEVGASADTWGTKLNDNLDGIDALFSAGPVLKVANGGTAATTASGARTSLGLGTMATQDASSVAITGGAVSVGTLGVSATIPYLNLTETDASADNGVWLIYAQGETFFLYAENDALTSGTAAIQIERTGTAVDSIALAAAAVTINGNAVYHAGNDGAGSGLDADTLDGQQATAFAAVSSGTFTAELADAASGGTVLASGAAYWKKVGNIVSLRLPILRATTTATTLFLRGIPADIQPSLTGTYIQTILVLGYRNGSLEILALQVEEATAAWTIAGISGVFDSSSSSKGIGTSSSAAPSIVYQIAD